jgi:diketogulonate reductase-like aldo/keto reductase
MRCILTYISVPRGSTVIAKSVSPQRIKDNLNIIKLDDEDVKLLNDYSDDLVKNGKVQRFVYPPFGVNFGFPDKQ